MHHVYMHIYIYAYICIYTYIYICIPRTEEIRLKIFGSRDLSGFPIDLLSDGDFVYTRANSMKTWELP